ncbi:MAG: tRNA pseudouridine(38-40) synthase TruA, partial [Ignavibacteriae bacterium]|nr:tRNA pseudouridine(38-40) synthase TruA [Ignavibacteriota bacterium]
LLELYQIKSALNGSLADDIVIHDAVDVEEDFHARYNAKQRVYKYSTRQSESALERKYPWLVRYELDIERMKQVAQVILGEHDFEGFAKVGSDVKHFVCHVSTSEWHVSEKRLTYTISADRFLRGMVRSLVGTMVDVGRGFLSLDIFKERLDNRLKYEPRSAAPAHGLVLERVYY